VNIPFDAILDPRLAAALDEAQRAVWRELRREMFRAVCGTPHDPRHLLLLDADAAQVWRRRRREFLAAHFAKDSRVRLERE
jgi:hypothetical protein